MKKLYLYDGPNGEQLRIADSLPEAILDFGVEFNLDTGEGLDAVSEIDVTELDKYRGTCGHMALILSHIIQLNPEASELRAIANALNDGDVIKAFAIMDSSNQLLIPGFAKAFISDYYAKESESFSRMILNVT